MAGLTGPNGEQLDGNAANAAPADGVQSTDRPTLVGPDIPQPDPVKAQRVRNEAITGSPDGKFRLYEPYDGSIPWQQFDQMIKGRERPVDEQLRLANAMTLGPMVGESPANVFRDHDAWAEVATGKPTPPAAFHEKVIAAGRYRNLLMEKSEVMFEAWKRYMAEGEMRFTPQEQARLDRIEEHMPSQEMLTATGFWDRLFMDAAGQGVQMFRNNIASLDTTAAITLGGLAVASIISRGKIAGMPQVVNGTITTAGRAALLRTGRLVAQGHMVGVAAEGGKNELGFSLMELMEMRAPNGDEIPDDVKFWAAGAYGVVATTLEYAGVSTGARMIPGFRDLLQDGMSSLVMKRGLHAIIAEHAKRYGANALVQAGEEMSQSIVESLLQEAALHEYANRQGARYERELAEWTQTIGFYADAEKEMPLRLQQAYDEWVEEVQSGARQIKSRWEQMMPKALDEARSALNASLVLGAPASGAGVVSTVRNPQSQIDPGEAPANEYSDLAAKYGDTYSPAQAAEESLEGPGRPGEGQQFRPAYSSAEQESVARSRQVDEAIMDVRKRRSVSENTLNRLSSEYGKRVSQVARASDRKDMIDRERARIGVLNSMISEMTNGELNNVYEDPALKNVMLDLERFDPRTGEVIEREAPNRKPQIIITNTQNGVDGIVNHGVIRANWKRLQQQYNLTEDDAKDFAQTLMKEAENNRLSVEFFDGYRNRDEIRNAVANAQQMRVQHGGQEVAPQLNLHFKFQDFEDFAAERVDLRSAEEIAEEWNNSIESFFELYDDVQNMRTVAEQKGTKPPDVHLYLDGDRFVDPDQRITFRTIRDSEDTATGPAKKNYVAEKKSPLRGFRPRGNMSKDIWSFLKSDERIVDDDQVLRGDMFEEMRSLVEENPDFDESDPRTYRMKDPLTPERLEERKQQIMAKRALNEMRSQAQARERQRVGYTQEEAELQLSTAFAEITDHLFRQNDFTKYESGEFASITSERIWNMMAHLEGKDKVRRTKERAKEHRRWNTALNLYVDLDMGERLPEQVFLHADSIFKDFETKKKIRRLEHDIELQKIAETEPGSQMAERALADIKKLIDEAEFGDLSNLTEKQLNQIARIVGDNFAKLDPEVADWLSNEAIGYQEVFQPRRQPPEKRGSTEVGEVQTDEGQKSREQQLSAMAEQIRWMLESENEKYAIAQEQTYESLMEKEEELFDQIIFPEDVYDSVDDGERQSLIRESAEEAFESGRITQEEYNDLIADIEKPEARERHNERVQFTIDFALQEGEITQVQQDRLTDYLNGSIDRTEYRIRQNREDLDAPEARNYDREELLDMLELIEEGKELSEAEYQQVVRAAREAEEETGRTDETVSREEEGEQPPAESLIEAVGPGVERRGMWDGNVHGSHINQIISDVNEINVLRRSGIHFDEELRLQEILQEDSSPRSDIIAKAIRPPEEIQNVAKELRRRYDDIMERAIDNRVITEVAANFTARFWDDEQKHVYMGDATELRSYTRHNLQRPLGTIIEGWALGNELAIEEATISYEVYAQEVEKQISLRNFIEQGQKVRDISGNKLFSPQANIPGYRDINVGEVKQKVYLGETSGNARLMEQNANDPTAEVTGVVPEEHHVVEGTSVYEYRPLYAPQRIARVIEDMFSQSQLEGKTAVRLWLRWANFRKKVKLLSNFFHPFAFMRSYMFGTQHKTTVMTARPVKAIREFHKLLTGKESKWVDKAVGAQDSEFLEYYGLSRDANQAIREMVRLLAANTLTLDMRKDYWNLQRDEHQSVINEAQKHTQSKQTLQLVSHIAKSLQWLTFDVMGPSLKTASAVTELIHEMKTNPGEDLNIMAKRVAQRMNDDYGGLNLAREGRSAVHQTLFRAAIMAPDWTESNVRTMVRMLDGRVDKETRKGYRKFWWRAGVKIAMLNLIANFMMGLLSTSQGDSDDPIDFMIESKRKVLEHMGQVGEHPEAIRKSMHLIEVDVTPLWKYLADSPLNDVLGATGDKKGMFDVEPGETIYTDAIGGHFGDFLKFASFPIDSALGKGSMAIQDLKTITGRQDWKGYELKRPGEVEYDKLNDVFDPEAYMKYSSGGGAPAANFKDLTIVTAMAHIILSAFPVQADQWVAYHAGREDAMRAILTSLGIGVSSMHEYRSSGMDLGTGNKRF